MNLSILFRTRNDSKNAHYQTEVTPFVYTIDPCNKQKAIGTKIELYSTRL